jgi:glycosyltransferase involved in cell wall biosynthesis
MIHATLPGAARPRDGGVSHAVHGLANALVQRGHAVRVLSLDSPPPDAAYAGVRLRAWGAPVGAVHLAGTTRARLRRYYGVPCAVVGQWGRLGAVDVLHTHGDDWLLGPARWLHPLVRWVDLSTRRPEHHPGHPSGPARTPAPPVVRTFYGSALAEALASPALAHRLNHLVLYLTELVSALAATAVVAISRATQRHFPRVQHVIPPGVDLGTFRPGPAAARSAVPAVLFVGTLHGRKRGALVLRVFQDVVRPRLPQAELWMVCPEPVAAPGVVWLGKLPRAALVERYQRAWVVCLPSTYEGFGLPALEAMACGTPVVATPNPGACEVLDGGRYGLLVPAGALGHALVALLQDGAQHAALAAAGLARAAAYGWDTIAAAYEAVYYEVHRTAD